MNTVLKQKFASVRNHTEQLCKPLEIEDYSVQPIEDVSPPKWHLAHTTWFFEEFILSKQENYKRFDKDFAFLFNSYYESVGKRVLRTNRGNLTRPTVEKVYAYRAYVNNKIEKYLSSTSVTEEMKSVFELGLNHEQQHQELLLTDIKYILGHNPLFPPYATYLESTEEQKSRKFLEVKEGVYSVGYEGESFHFDNEKGVHKQYVHPFSIADKLVTNAEFIEFIEAQGYQKFKFWHAEGWNWVKEEQITAPLYWHKIDGKWYHYTLNGLQLVYPNLPVAHISFYEASAYAEFKNLRLPTEFEWEIASDKFDWGQRWEWTESAYLPYPKFSKAPGAIGEYNGKFMVNQKILRGGSVATAQNHSRKTYRNFFHPHLRWQYTGIRLVKTS